MRASFLALRSRGLQSLGSMSMYRTVLLALVLLFTSALGVSFTGQLSAQPLALVLSLAATTAGVVVADVAGHLAVRRPLRVESGFVTAVILVFVLMPTADPLGLAVLVLAGFLAGASKYLLAIRGRHVFNPAAAGAAAVTLTGVAPSMWWIGTPLLAVPVVVLGVAVAWRAEQLRTAALFVVVAVPTTVVARILQAQQHGLAVAFPDVLAQAALSSPVLFLGLFMLTEPLTLPAGRIGRVAVAVVVAVLVGAPVTLGTFFLLPEAAILVGNLVALGFAWRSRRALRAAFVQRREPAPGVVEATLRIPALAGFQPGQYLELEVPHRRPDARGTRREFSIVSPPSELPQVRIAYRVPDGRSSTYKRALGLADDTVRLHATGVWGEFTLPSDAADPVLLVGAGIGVTPFVSQLAATPGRDVVLVLVAASADGVPYLDELLAAGVRAVLVTRDEPADLPPHARWAGGGRLTAAALEHLVPDLSARRAYVSGPPRLVADLAPTLRHARSLHTDAFAGY